MQIEENPKQSSQRVLQDSKVKENYLFENLKICLLIIPVCSCAT